jgi:ubiquinone/menaquinone biosynthesis C-methylase UbiE
MYRTAFQPVKNGTTLPLAKENDQPFPPAITPEYLEQTYWWAYIRPRAVRFFEKQWVINLILWGNFEKLRDDALNELGQVIPGRTLQVACVYGDFSTRLAQRIAVGGSLDIVDVLPIQLENVRKKLPAAAPVRTILSDSTALNFAHNEEYDQAILFFLLHEMPAVVRVKTLNEVIRVMKPGGRLVIVEFHKPHMGNPFRYFYPLLFRLLEPFALDTWKHEIAEWLPSGFTPSSIRKETLFGGLYQKIVIRK